MGPDLSSCDRASVASATLLIAQDGPYSHIKPLLRFAEKTVRSADRDRRPRLLDTCCGTGRLAKEFSQIGWDVTGLDASGELIAKAQHAHSRAKTAAAFFTADDLTQVDLPEAEFDLIVAFDDLAAELVDPTLLSQLLDLSLRCLTIGGHLIFQLEREEAPPPTLTLAAIRRAGAASWRASPLRLDEPVDLEHLGSRDIFVARRDH
jgi:SAM-dependent methyltransferase